MIKISKKVENLSGCISFSCECHNCSKKLEAYGYWRTEDFAEELVEEGWRVTRAGNVLCSNCKRMKK